MRKRESYASRPAPISWSAAIIYMQQPSLAEGDQEVKEVLEMIRSALKKVVVIGGGTGNFVVLAG